MKLNAYAEYSVLRRHRISLSDVNEKNILPSIWKIFSQSELVTEGIWKIHKIFDSVREGGNVRHKEKKGKGNVNVE